MAKKEKHKIMTFGEKSKAELLAEKLTFALSIILLLVSFIPQFELARDILRMISVVMAAYPAVEDMFEGISKKKISEPLFLIVAIIATWIAGEFPQAALIAILYRVSRWIRKFAKNIALGSVKSLDSLTIESAHLILEAGDTESVDSKDIKKGMKLRVLPRETVPIDCVVTDGKSTAESFDTSDKSAPRLIKPGDRLSAGTKNGSATISVEALNDASDSKIEKIIGIVNGTSGQMSSAEERISNTMKYVSAAAAVIAVAAGIIGTLLTGYAGTWIRNAVVILTASFTSSVVALIPVPLIAYIGRAAKRGVVLRDIDSIEKMSKADTAVFDNPGMLSSEKLTAGEVFAEPGYSEEDMLSLASLYAEETDDDLLREITGDIEINRQPGDEKILCGDADVMKKNDISVSSLPKASLYISVDGKAVGCIQVGNKTNDSVRALIRSLKELKLQTVLLSDEENNGADTVCADAGIDKCVPGNKNSALEKIRSGEHTEVYISDKADYPKKADVKIAFGGSADDMPQKAGVIITSESGASVASELKQSRRTMNIVKFNTGLLLLVKAAAVVLAFMSLAPTYVSVLSETAALAICMIVTFLSGKISKSAHSK